MGKCISRVFADHNTYPDESPPDPMHRATPRNEPIQMAHSDPVAIHIALQFVGVSSTNQQLHKVMVDSPMATVRERNKGSSFTTHPRMQSHLQ